MPNYSSCSKLFVTKKWFNKIKFFQAINQQYSLTVEDFKKSDEGCYTIEASNDSGSCSSSAYLTMEGINLTQVQMYYYRDVFHFLRIK